MRYAATKLFFTLGFTIKLRLDDVNYLFGWYGVIKPLMYVAARPFKMYMYTLESIFYTFSNG